MIHFDRYLPIRLYSGLERGVDDTCYAGALELWFPYITLDTSRTISASIFRLATDEFDASDQESFFIFFHEYIHLIQSACFPVCHMPVELTYCFIYDVHQTAKKRKLDGKRSLLPIEHSNVFDDVCEHLLKTYLHTTIVEGLRGNTFEFSVVHILEGVARILEEKVRGCRQPPDELYDSLRSVNEAVLGEDKLDDRELLELAEEALGYEYPDDMLVQLLAARRDGCEVKESPCWDENAERRMILQDGKGVLSSSFFVELREYLNRFYDDMPRMFKKGAVFTSIYDSIEAGEKRCIPIVLIDNMLKIGLPIVAYKSGEMESFNPYETGSPANAGIALRAFEAVCKALLDVENAECNCLVNCEAAQRSGERGIPSVDCDCHTKPWAKNNGGGLCPFTAALQAFHLENLTRGECKNTGNDIGAFYDKMLLHYKPGEIFGCEVRIWSNDSGNQPHIHIKTKNTGRNERPRTKIDCCVRIDVAEYFVHGSHTDTLNNSQCKELYEFLQRKNKKNVDKTNWEMFAEEWNRHYPTRSIPKGTAFPDYRTLNG